MKKKFLNFIIAGFILLIAVLTNPNQSKHEDIVRIASTYHACRNNEGGYEKMQDSAELARLTVVEANNFVLIPCRYVGTEEVEDGGVPFEEKSAAITDSLSHQFDQSVEFQKQIKLNVI